MTIARVLGIAQDAGVPHVGCACVRCERFRDAPLLPACLGLEAGRAWLIDATPALPAQLRMLERPLGGVLLTHLHMGHVAGLLQLGPEALAPKALPLLATARVLDVLARNAPWELLFRRGHLVPRPITPGKRTTLEPGLDVEPVAVPHRDEYADTVGYVVHGLRRALLYVPDADHWNGVDLDGLLDRCDLALLDGTFFSRGELPGRGDVPHPPIEETIARLTDERAAKVRFTHLNHTNPVLDPEGPNALLALQGDVYEI
jgi:pyrroloquinoline quinone biosynthesis protein B